MKFQLKTFKSVSGERTEIRRIFPANKFPRRSLWQGIRWYCSDPSCSNYRQWSHIHIKRNLDLNCKNKNTLRKRFFQKNWICIVVEILVSISSSIPLLQKVVTKINPDIACSTIQRKLMIQWAFIFPGSHYHFIPLLFRKQLIYFAYSPDEVAPATKRCNIRLYISKIIKWNSYNSIIILF